jgi:hypothetical protein
MRARVRSHVGGTTSKTQNGRVDLVEPGHYDLHWSAESESSLV